MGQRVTFTDMSQFDRLGNDMSDDLADLAAWEREDEIARQERMEAEMYVDPAQEAMDDEIGAMYGDPCYCPRHPSQQVKSACGMFDAPCGACEYESDKAAEEWEIDPTNDFRAHCGPGTYISREPRYPLTCLTTPDVDDGIPF